MIPPTALVLSPLTTSPQVTRRLFDPFVFSLARHRMGLYASTSISRRQVIELRYPEDLPDMKKSRSKKAESPSELIDARIEDLGDWRGEMLSRLRALIKEADPDVAEEWKWRRDSRLVAQRAHLHRRDVQERREDDLRQGSLPEGPFRPLQFQSRRQRQARHRLPRRRQAEREGSEGSRSGRRRLEQVFSAAARRSPSYSRAQCVCSRNPRSLSGLRTT